MKYFKSIFNNKPDQIKCTQHSYSTIYDSNSPTVHLDDIKTLIKDEQKRTYFFHKNPNSILEEVKMLYTIHMMMIADQVSDIDAVNQCLQSGRIVYKSRTENGNNHLQTYQQTYTQQQSQYNNSLYLNSSEHPSIATDQLESDLTNLYYSYLQRAANNYDIYQSCQKMQYPYLDETGNRRVQYLWLFKIVNLLNFKIAMIPFIQKALFHASSLFGIAKDVSILILKDCINEYMFVKRELEEQMDYYSQFNLQVSMNYICNQNTQQIDLNYSIILEINLQNMKNLKNLLGLGQKRNVNAKLKHIFKKLNLLIHHNLNKVYKFLLKKQHMNIYNSNQCHSPRLIRVSIKQRKKILNSYCHLNLKRRNKIPKLIPIEYEFLNLFSHYNYQLMNPKPDDDDDVEVIDFDDIINFDDYDESNQPHQIGTNISQPNQLKVIYTHNNTTTVTQSQEKQSQIKVATSCSKQQTQKQDPNYNILRDVNMQFGFNYFLTHPTPKGGLIQCRLYRAEPKFSLFLEQSNTLLMGAEKKSFKLRSSYAIFDSGKKEHYLGKVKGDFMGSQFMIYDNGKTKKKSKSDEELRKEIGMVYYQPYKKTLREIQAYIPIIHSNGEMHEFKPKQQHQSMLYNLHNVIELLNQKPIWIPKQRAYGLNLYGRVKESSVKNFLLIEKGNENPILLFGKTDNREYVLDFSYPLSPIQAFAIALSSIDHKFSCK